MRQVAIVLFDDVEVLDFAGPYEVFSVAGEYSKPSEFKVMTVSENGQSIRARNGLKVQPDYSFENCPQPDILLIPGGFGTRQQMHNPVILAWIKQMNQHTELTVSVCTGALVLGSAGLLEGLNATTHASTFDELRAIAPNTTVLEGERFVDNGHIITAGGVSAGIDMALYLVRKLAGETILRATVKEMEYEYYQGS